MSLLVVLRRGLIMGNWGIKVSKPNKSITSTVPEDYIFNSKFGSVIIYKEDEVSVTIPANDHEVSTVNYYAPDGVTPLTFDYCPVVLIYAELVPGSGIWYLAPFTFYPSIDTYVSATIDNVLADPPLYSYVDKDKFELQLQNITSSEITVKYHYYIFANLG